MHTLILNHANGSPWVFLLTAFAAVLQERRVTTHIEVVRDGQDGSDLFYSLLIDDPDDLDQPAEQQAAAGASGSSNPSPTGVDQFIQHIKAEVSLQLQPAR
jgi:hypothetical protein